MLFRSQVKLYTHSPMKAARYSLRSFFVDCHKVQGWTVFQELQIRQPLQLPIVLSREDVHKVLQAVREPRLRVCLTLIYHCGLRVSEAVGIQVRDLIESRTLNPRLHVRNGKGGNGEHGTGKFREPADWKVCDTKAGFAVAQAFQPAGSGDFPVAKLVFNSARQLLGTRNRKVP